MRKDLLVLVLGLLIGSATLTVAEEEDPELLRRLQMLKEAITRLELARGPALDRLPPLAGGEELELFPVYDLTSGRPDFVPPDHRLRRGERERPLFGGVSEEWPQPVGTVEELTELVRTAVAPESYEERGVITPAGQTLLLVNSPAVLEDTRRFLDRKVRQKVHRCVTVEVEAVDVMPDLYRALVDGTSSSLSAEQRAALDGALAEGSATRAFQARGTGFVGQNIVTWHGRQVAFVADVDVMTAKGKVSPDPSIGVVQAGGYLSVRSSVGEDHGRVTLDLDLRFDELEALESRAMGRAGAVDLPHVRTVKGTTSVTVPDRGWAFVSGGARVGGRMRVLLVRPTYLERKGGGR